jgi:PhoPQ-activated pathogenicity-related protein
MLIGAGTQTSTQVIKIINPDNQNAMISFTAQGTGGTPLTITGINPNTATKGQTATFTLTGTGFQSGFTAKIINELSQEWDISQKEFVSATTVRVTMLIGAGTQTSTQVIKIINPDSQSATISFTAQGTGSTPLTITGINPNTATKGQTATFTLTGTGFQSGFTAKIINELSQEWDIATKEFVSATTVRVTMLIGAGTQTSTQVIKIINPDSQSATISFTAQGTTADPTITSIKPTQSAATTFDLEINGTNFDSGAVDQVYWKADGHFVGQGTIISRTGTRIVSRQSMTGTAPGTYVVKVRNSNGTLSNGADLSITGTTLSITGINPSTVTKGQTVTFTLTGTGFQSGFTAKIINELSQEWDIASKEFVSSTTVRVTMLIGAGTQTSTQVIKIINPDSQSAMISFTAQGVATLAITGINPSTVTKGQTVTFTLTGTGFQSGFTAKLINELNQQFDITQKEFVSSIMVKVTVYLGSGLTSTQVIKIINPDNQNAMISFMAQGDTPTLSIDGGTSSSKPRGGTYVFAGSHYTPSRTLTRYLRQPDGSTIIMTPTLSADGNGNINWSFTSIGTTPIGTYSIWVVDDSTGRTSNTVSEIVTSAITRIN